MVMYIGYDANGRCRGQLRTLPPRATKLRWDLPPAARDLIAKCKRDSELLVNDLDLHILNHDSFGKAEIKRCKTSPDAFIQLALQLAYARGNHGRQCMTYESSMTRLFREGRTETVRPCTKESVAWVKSMLMSEKTSVEERKDLFRKAVDKHQLMYKDAMTGKGVDRHLFCLYVVSRYLELDSPFLKVNLSGLIMFLNMIRAEL